MSCSRREGAEGDARREGRHTYLLSLHPFISQPSVSASAVVDERRRGRGWWRQRRRDVGGRPRRHSSKHRARQRALEAVPARPQAVATWSPPSQVGRGGPLVGVAVAGRGEGAAAEERRGDAGDGQRRRGRAETTTSAAPLPAPGTDDLVATSRCAGAITPSTRHRPPGRGTTWSPRFARGPGGLLGVLIKLLFHFIDVRINQYMHGNNYKRPPPCPPQGRTTWSPHPGAWGQ